jgi:hypothetical protein
MPEKLKKAEFLKMRLGLKRDEKIPLNLISKIEKMFNSNINIEGVFNYTSTGQYKYIINLICKNEHVELKQNNNKNPNYFNKFIGWGSNELPLLIYKYEKEAVRIFTEEGESTVSFTDVVCRELLEKASP